jgi:hypothetical protein
MMTDQPSRVTPAEISALLEHARQLEGGASLDDQIAYHEHKASLLSRIAADTGTTEAHDVAADAWAYLATLCRRADRPARPEVAP